ncbi:MAG: HAD family hydrolase [Lachnospiraceae bacterium]|nr:HAD family hydrolase [Lachnospiraceae bacterium]
MKDIAAVIFDLDDTLLRSDKSISDYTLGVLKKCKERGIYIGVATARNELSAGSFIQVNDFDIVISNGGARVTIGEECIYKKMMSASTVRKIIDIFFEIGGNELTVETEEDYFWNYTTKPEGSWAHAKYNDFSNFNSPAYKITALLDTPELAQHICHEVDAIETLNFRGEKWRRFASIGADKVSAIREVTKYLGIGISEIAAFGDDYNDIEMLKAVGMGVAMGNAIEEVKTVAKYIALSNDEDGAARFIADNIL